MSKELLKIQKTGFQAFQKAISGDINEIQSILNVFHQQRMLILSNVPNSSQLRKELCHAAMQFDTNQSTQKNLYFSVGTNHYNGMISHMNNYHSFPDTLEIAEKLGYQAADSPDLLLKCQNPNIVGGYSQVEENFINFTRPLFLGFFKIIDQYLRLSQFQSSPTLNMNLNQQLSEIVQRSEVQKYRNLFLYPKQQTLETNQFESELSVPWHFDVSLATILFKEMYVIKDDASPLGYIEIEQPKNGIGLIIRDAYGSDHSIEIEEDEIIIQGGISLQILTNDLLKAQVHCVKKPTDQNIGRISNTTFFYPSFNTKMETNDPSKSLEIQQLDMNVLDPLVKFSNHWKQGVQWIEFHHNQMLQFLLKAYVESYKNKNGNQNELKVQFYSFKVPQGEVKMYHFNVLDSTMEPAKFWHKHYVSEKNSFAFMADQQSSGRGQNQNQWLSPKGNCYVTFLVKFESDLSYCIPQLAALSVVQTLTKYIQDNGVEVKPVLKWINDIHINDKKIAGVLCIAEGDFLQIGIGVNLNQNPNLDLATNLKKELNLPEDINVVEFIEQLSQCLMANLQEVQHSRSYLNIIFKIQQQLKYLNEKVIIYDETLTNVLHSGLFIGLNEYGNAILQQPSGEKLSIIHGRMRNQQE